MLCSLSFSFFFFFNDTATTEIYTLSLHDALPISGYAVFEAKITEDIGSKSKEVRDSLQDLAKFGKMVSLMSFARSCRSEEHTSELQSLRHLVCRLLLEKKKNAATHGCCLDRPYRR